ncbi:MAG: DUF1343 domain-containing protein [Lentisphaerae bacterium]|nr:DUF1343 domain-containing protein [Lentisphaerota bacterium]
MKHLYPGIDALLSRHRNWLRGKRIGLVSHAAAVDLEGRSSAERMARDRELALVRVFSPEHGFFGSEGPGVFCRDAVLHPSNIPIVSLYGKHRKPTPAMLGDVDVLVFDMQDIGVRCYTYLATLLGCLEAAAGAGMEVIVADRPIPLPVTCDGPVTTGAHTSFVAPCKVPLVHGMTPGEAATWLCRHHDLRVQLKVAKMRGYRRQCGRDTGWPPWVPPSPAMISWESAVCYPSTVCLEALPAVDHGRHTNLPFQLLGARWMRGHEMADILSACRLPGVKFYPHSYSRGDNGKGRPVHYDGIRIVVTSPEKFKPALTSVTILHALGREYGFERLWEHAGTRPEFFDRLFGTIRVRRALMAGKEPAAIAGQWRKPLTTFRAQRRACLLYRKS